MGAGDRQGEREGGRDGEIVGERGKWREREGNSEREKERELHVVMYVLCAGSNNKEFSFRHDWNSLISDDETLFMKYYTKDYFPHADVYVSRTIVFTCM